MVFQRNLSESKSPQVSRTLLSILADIINTIICVVRFFLLFTILPVFLPFWTVQGYHFQLVSLLPLCFIAFFFSSSARFKYLLIFLSSFIFPLWSAKTVKSTGQQVLFVYFLRGRVINTRSSLLGGITTPISWSKIFWGFFANNFLFSRSDLFQTG